MVRKPPYAIKGTYGGVRGGESPLLDCTDSFRSSANTNKEGQAQTPGAIAKSGHNIKKKNRPLRLAKR